MPKTLLTIFLLALVSYSVNAQSPILTSEENAEWLASFKSQNLEEQLKMLRNRVASDSSICLKPLAHACGMTRRRSTPVEQCQEPSTRNTTTYLFIELEANKSLLIHRTPDMDYSKLIKMTNFLNAENTSQITVMDQPMASALYGTSAAFGVLKIELTYPETLESLAQLFDREL